MLACLIDRRGAILSTKEIMTVLYGDDNQESYVRNLRSDLMNTFEKYGIDEALVREGKDIGLNISKIDCDYYDYLNGCKELFRGEYMTQYSFAEETLGWLSMSSL